MQNIELQDKETYKKIVPMERKRTEALRKREDVKHVLSQLSTVWPVSNSGQRHTPFQSTKHFYFYKTNV
jgi:hypothetical protein